MTRIVITNDDHQGTTRVVVQVREHAADERVIAVLGPGERCMTTVETDRQAVLVHEIPHAPDTMAPDGVPT